MKMPLESGTICLKHKCSLCCHRTNMLLTYFDMNRIVKLGYGINGFAEKMDGCWHLKNVDGKCFFLNDGLCRIYKYRPYGCQLYPLIFNLERGKVMLDEICPYRLEFRVNADDVRKLIFMLKILKILQ
ncbi:YkgJ family cysteine cluster protein [Candidatus Bathyarchaeota archaeon]|nr:YkgJ family cysteine cluster protein [Candidatus Bathyarchaeota archaeon]